MVAGSSQTDQNAHAMALEIRMSSDRGILESCRTSAHSRANTGIKSSVLQTALFNTEDYPREVQCCESASRSARPIRVVLTAAIEMTYSAPRTRVLGDLGIRWCLRTTAKDTNELMTSDSHGHPSILTQ